MSANVRKPADMDIQRFSSRDELSAALAERLNSAASSMGALMLSGGSTPGPAYRLVRPPPGLVAATLHILYSDERLVPPTSDASNYRLSRPLLTALSLTGEQVLRVRTELPLESAAEDYDRRLAGLLESRTIRLGLLGLGADGHTASLFSLDDIERSRARWAIAVHRPDGRSAVSVTPQLLAQIKEVLFVVAGHDKREALAALARGDATLVATRAIAGCTRVEVWADSEAWPA